MVTPPPPFQCVSPITCQFLFVIGWVFVIPSLYSVSKTATAPLPNTHTHTHTHTHTQCLLTVKTSVTSLDENLKPDHRMRVTRSLYGHLSGPDTAPIQAGCKVMGICWSPGLSACPSHWALLPPPFMVAWAPRPESPSSQLP